MMAYSKEPIPIADRVPFDAELEEHCIAAALVASEDADATLLADLLSILSPRMFHREHYGDVWASISDLHLRGEPVNQVTVAAEMARNDTLEAFGGQTRLGDLIRQLPTSVGAQWYAEQVRSMYTARRIMSIASGLQIAVSNEPARAEEVADEWIAKLLTVGETSRRQSVVTASDFYVEGTADLYAFLQNPGEVRGVRSPWPSLDRRLGGFRGSAVYVLAADTSVGKSLFVQQVAMHAALQGLTDGVPVVFASGEMSAQEVFERLAFMRAEVDPQDGVRRGSFSPNEQAAVEQAIAELIGMQMAIVNDLSLATVVSQARRLVSAGRCEMLVVDHIQHVSVPGLTNRTDAITEAMKQLKQLAVSEGIPVLIVSHINRSSQREGITTASAKDASAIEQDANVMLALQPGRWDSIEGANVWLPLTGEDLENWQARNKQTDVRVRILKHRAGLKTSVYLRQDWSRGGQYVEVGD